MAVMRSAVLDMENSLTAARLARRRVKLWLPFKCAFTPLTMMTRIHACFSFPPYLGARFSASVPMLQPVKRPPRFAVEPSLSRAERVAAIAAAHADAVDAEARSPKKPSTRLKAKNFWASWCRRALGGEEASVADVVDVCYRLGRACSSTGMIYAMHQVKAACVVHHGMGSAWHRDFMARMVDDQLLLASSTTEGGAAAMSAPPKRR